MNEYIFLINNWLSVYDEYNIEYKIKTSTLDEIQNPKYLIKENMIWGFRESHDWISIFIRL